MTATIRFQLFMIGQLTGNAINFGFFQTREDAMLHAAKANPNLYAAPFIKEVAI